MLIFFLIKDMHKALFLVELPKISYQHFSQLKDHLYFYKEVLGNMEILRYYQLIT